MSRTFTLRKLECLKQAHASNTLAWNEICGLGFTLSVFRAEVMMKRDTWGYMNSTVRGEILGSVEVELLCKRLPRISSLIKKES